jgi:hypothetical protein
MWSICSRGICSIDGSARVPGCDIDHSIDTCGASVRSSMNGQPVAAETESIIDPKSPVLLR